MRDKFAGKIRTFLTKPAVQAAALFAAAASFFSFIQAAPVFGDPDAFYHLKMAELIMDRGLVRDFPWLPLTTLAGAFADQHFLYHLLLTPFIAALGPFAGMRAATVVFAAAAIVVAFYAFRTFGVRGAFWYSLLMMTCGGFLFRMMLSKASQLSVAAALLGLVFAKKGWTKAVFFLAFAFVWLHGAWPLMIPIALAPAVGSIVAAWMGKRLSLATLRRLAADGAFGPFLGACLGMAAGLVVNPFFPKNLVFDWEQIVQIALVNYRSMIAVGNEWRPIYLDVLLRQNLPLAAVLAAGVAALVAAMSAAARPRLEGRDFSGLIRDYSAVLFLAVAALAMTLRQQRHVEYFVPFGMLAGAMFLNLSLSLFDWKAVWARLAGSAAGRFAAVAALAAASGLAVWWLAWTAMGERAVMATRIPWNQFAAAGEWMKLNLPPGAMVFHGRWDDFPMLFLADDSQRYVAGLDPTFFYLRDPGKYQLWDDIAGGRRRVGLAGLVKSDFGAGYVFLRAAADPLYPLVRNNPDFVQVYRDGQAMVYKVKWK